MVDYQSLSLTSVWRGKLVVKPFDNGGDSCRPEGATPEEIAIDFAPGFCTNIFCANIF